ncbi:hypothetical protein [Streptomyces sp. 4F14]|uniref:hypothetical protein n=1 Tax=Streptomyces sp. 4F14 TaxID=3394380 RepID=UPI003A85E1D3
MASRAHGLPDGAEQGPPVPLDAGRARDSPYVGNRPRADDVRSCVEDFLYLAVMFAPFVTPWVALAALVAAARHLRGAGRPRTATYALAALAAGASAFGAYGWGVMSGFHILDPDQMCAAQGLPGDRIVTRMTLPVSAQCVTGDGVGSELVPGWVNPVVYAGIALSVLAAGAAVWKAGRQRASSPAAVSRKPQASR